MNGYNFTDRVRKVLQMAREEAARLHHEYVGTEHILLGLIREGEGVAAAVLTNLNVDLEDIQQKIEETVKKGKAAAAAGPDLPYTSRAKKVLELAMTEARELNHSYVGTSTYCLACFEKRRHRRPGAHDAGSTWSSRGPSETLRLLGSDMPQASAGGSSAQPSRRPSRRRSHKTPALDHFCRDLTQLAAEGQLDPTIGGPRRSSASWRSGPPEEEQPGSHRRARRRQDGHRRGLALLIAKACAPMSARPSCALLDMAAVIAGTKYRGQFEAAQGVMNEIAQNKQIILFIDELHTLVGRRRRGAIDASNMLKRRWPG